MIPVIMHDNARRLKLWYKTAHILDRLRGETAPLGGTERRR